MTRAGRRRSDRLPRGGASLGRALVALLAALAAPGAAAPPAGAHPHVFVEHVVTVLVGAEGLEGLHFAWTFDEMFSSMVVLTFDADKDKRFSAGEMKAVEQKHFANLKDFDYFVQLRVNDKPVPVTAFKGFEAKLVNGQVVYAFTIPVKAAEGTLEVAVEDPTYYSAFALNQRAPVHVQSAKTYRVDCRVARDGGAVTELVKCAFRRQGK
jgi:ABC-type uncharacterized transport system substrate-binding protein